VQAACAGAAPQQGQHVWWLLAYMAVLACLLCCVGTQHLLPCTKYTSMRRAVGFIEYHVFLHVCLLLWLPAGCLRCCLVQATLGAWRGLLCTVWPCARSTESATS
jgi:hypothetical protein